MRRFCASAHAIDLRPSHPSLQCFCARGIRRTTIANIFPPCRYVSEGDDAGAASGDDDDDDEDAEVEEVEEEDDEGATEEREYSSYILLRSSHPRTAG